MVKRIQEKLAVSERRACKVLGQPRASQRHAPIITVEEERLREDIVKLASKYGRYGYRRVTAMLNNDEG